MNFKANVRSKHMMFEYCTYHRSMHLLITSTRFLLGKFSCVYDINIYIAVLVDYHSLVQTFI